MATTYIPLATQTLATASASVTFSSIPQTYTDLVVVANLGKSLTGSAVEFRFNSDSGSNYSITELYGNGTSAASARVSSSAYGQVAYDVVPGSDITSNFVFNVMNYANTAVNKTTLSRNDSMATTYSGAAAIVGLWRSTAAINSITFTSSGGATFTTGSTFNLYGIASASVGTPKATGGNIITTDGSYWYHAFTASGTFTPSSALSCDTLVVAGGGAGGGGGGGAGGYRSATGLSIPATSNTVTVGGGGTAQSGIGNGTSGSDSVFSSITSTGGGKGNLTGSPSTGGSGGGGGSGNYTSGAGLTGAAGNTPSTSPSQGNNGGNGSATGGAAGAGGGGGAGGVGGNFQSTNQGGVGGVGSNAHASWLGVVGLGVNGYLAGGGGGSCNGSTATGGLGGGGTGSDAGATSGTANTGSGGGGIYATYPSGAGGSGLVIVRYAV
jgi:hypothetical protein